MINVPDDLSNRKSAVSTFNPAFERVKHMIIINGLNDVFQIITAFETAFDLIVCICFDRLEDY